MGLVKPGKKLFLQRDQRASTGIHGYGALPQPQSGEFR